jgi:NAD(P)-dependent dehydrogenase (short-subunit alcohol dehydrogenase family)
VFGAIFYRLLFRSSPLTEEFSDKLVRQVFRGARARANVRGLLFTVQKALPLLKDGGVIILNASIVASIGMEAFSVYRATKAAVRSFARTWTSDLKKRKIRVNAISPGVVPTESDMASGARMFFGYDMAAGSNSFSPDHRFVRADAKAR